jgi:serine/threonine protein kinase
MSPELLDPESFGLEDSRPTKESDIYALGMVVCEVLSGQAPFPRHKDAVVIRKVLLGERPERPQGEQGAWFKDRLWEVLEHCWKPQRGDRPGLKTLLQCLEGTDFESGNQRASQTATRIERVIPCWQIFR